MPVRWTPSQNPVTHLADVDSGYVIPRVSPECTYLFGNDPAWGVTSNRLSMSNGVKMKMSVVFGVLHMMIGIVHKYANAIHRKHWAILITECIGGTIILLGLFGWMDFLVFQKWLTPLDIADRSVLIPGAQVLIPDYSNKDAPVKFCPVSRGDASLLT